MADAGLRLSRGAASPDQSRHAEPIPRAPAPEASGRRAGVAVPLAAASIAVAVLGCGVAAMDSDWAFSAVAQLAASALAVAFARRSAGRVRGPASLSAGPSLGLSDPAPASDSLQTIHQNGGQGPGRSFRSSLSRLFTGTVARNAAFIAAVLFHCSVFPVVATFGTAPSGADTRSWLLRHGLLSLVIAAADAVVVGDAAYSFLRVSRRVVYPLSDKKRADEEEDQGAVSAPQRRPRGFHAALLRVALSVPLEAAVAAAVWSRGGLGTAAAAGLAPYLHALRAPRCLFVLALSARFQALEDAVGEYARLRIVRMVTYLFLVQHLITCAWFALGHMQGFGTSAFVPSTALLHSPPGEQYLHALHWAVHGKGDATPHGTVQILFHAFALVVQELGLASIVGQVASLIANEDGAAARFRERLRRVDEHMAAVQVPHTLRRRVREFYLFLWRRDKSAAALEGEDVFMGLNDQLRGDIELHVHGSVLRRVPLFARVPEDFLRDLVRLLQQQLFTPGETIVVEAQVGREMYLLSRGQVRVVGSGGRVLNRLYGGSYFGELGLLFPTPRTATVVAEAFCDTYVLHDRRMRPLIEEWPEVWEGVMETTVANLRHMQGTNQLSEQLQGVLRELELRLQRPAAGDRSDSVSPALDHSAHPLPGGAADGTSFPPPPPPPPPPPLSKGPRRGRTASGDSETSRASSEAVPLAESPMFGDAVAAGGSDGVDSMRGADRSHESVDTAGTVVSSASRRWGEPHSLASTPAAASMDGGSGARSRRSSKWRHIKWAYVLSESLRHKERLAGNGGDDAMSTSTLSGNLTSASTPGSDKLGQESSMAQREEEGGEEGEKVHSDASSVRDGQGNSARAGRRSPLDALPILQALERGGTEGRSARERLLRHASLPAVKEHSPDGEVRPKVLRSSNSTPGVLRNASPGELWPAQEEAAHGAADTVSAPAPSTTPAIPATCTPTPAPAQGLAPAPAPAPVPSIVEASAIRYTAPPHPNIPLSQLPASALSPAAADEARPGPPEPTADVHRSSPPRASGPAAASVRTTPHATPRTQRVDTQSPWSTDSGGGDWAASAAARDWDGKGECRPTTTAGAPPRHPPDLLPAHARPAQWTEETAPGGVRWPPPPPHTESPDVRSRGSSRAVGGGAPRLAGARIASEPRAAPGPRRSLWAAEPGMQHRPGSRGSVHRDGWVSVSGGRRGGALLPPPPPRAALRGPNGPQPWEGLRYGSAAAAGRQSGWRRRTPAGAAGPGCAVSGHLPQMAPRAAYSSGGRLSVRGRGPVAVTDRAARELFASRYGGGSPCG